MLTVSVSRSKPRALVSRSGGETQVRGDAAAAMFGRYRDVLELGGIGERQVGMSERLVIFPGDEVEAVALLQPVKAENSSDVLGLLWGEWAYLHSRRG
jgi:hypothetical protein